MDRSPSVTGIGELEGPHAEDATRVLLLSAQLTPSQARRLAEMWEKDVNPDYDKYCEIIQKALDDTGRTLPLGWFEAFFADEDWTSSTKALHAIADAVVATLVKDEIPYEVFFAIVRPWWKFMRRNTATKLDLRKIKEICLT